MQPGSATRRTRKEDGAATAGGSGGSSWGTKKGPKTRQKGPQKAQKGAPKRRESCVPTRSQEGVRKTISLLLSLFAAFGRKIRNGAKVEPNGAQKCSPNGAKTVPKKVTQRPASGAKKGSTSSPRPVLGSPAAPVLHCAYEERRHAIQRPSDQIPTY